MSSRSSRSHFLSTLRNSPMLFILCSDRDELGRRSELDFQQRFFEPLLRSQAFLTSRLLPA
jgi:hypothetical protein